MVRKANFALQLYEFPYMYPNMHFFGDIRT